MAAIRRAAVRAGPCSPRAVAARHVRAGDRHVNPAASTADRETPDHGPRPVIRAMAQLAVERISSSDALYHDVHHTVLVTLVGQAILRGRIMVEEVTPGGLAALHRRHPLPRHRLPARRSAPATRTGATCRRGGQHGRGAARRLGRLPRPYHIERGKIFVRHRCRR